MLLLALACAAPPPALPVHHLAFGGDAVVGKRLNAALADPDARASILGDVAPMLREADLALVNLEGVVAGGGRVVDKGEPRPHLYRARPEMMGVLAEAGVDVLAMANNHSGDYGPDALREALDRARVAGLDYAGAGHDLADARTPAYRVVGDTVVAFVGADLTDTEAFAATADRPGTLAAPIARAVETLAPILAEARQHAHVVILTPHWGPNGATAPEEATREAGRALLRAGFDAVLGHSAHVPQGVELVDGKPIVYDAGNFLTPHDGTGDQAEGLLYDVAFTRAGVVSVRARPVRLRENRTLRGSDATVATWADRTRALGAEPEGDTVRCDPGDVEGPEGTPAPPERAVPTAVREAPSDALADALPPDAHPAAVRWADGVSLVGYRLVATALRVPKAAQVVDLWLRAEGPVAHDLTIGVEGRGTTVDVDPHYPADWMLPGDAWPAGALVHDRALLRLQGKPEGRVRFVLDLLAGGRAVDVVASDLPLDGGVVLGDVPYVQGAPRIFELPGMR